jgi:hypothetical protein
VHARRPICSHDAGWRPQHRRDASMRRPHPHVPTTPSFESAPHKTAAIQPSWHARAHWGPPSRAPARRPTLTAAYPPLPGPSRRPCRAGAATPDGTSPRCRPSGPRAAATPARRTPPRLRRRRRAPPPPPARADPRAARRRCCRHCYCRCWRRRFRCYWRHWRRRRHCRCCRRYCCWCCRPRCPEKSRSPPSKGSPCPSAAAAPRHPQAQPPGGGALRGARPGPPWSWCC